MTSVARVSADVTEEVTWATKYGVTYPTVRVMRRSDGPDDDSDEELADLQGKRTRGEISGLKVYDAAAEGQSRGTRVMRYAELRPLGANGANVVSVVLCEFRQRGAAVRRG